MATFRRPGCKCPKEKNKETRCKCGAAWSYRVYTDIDPRTGKRKQIEKSGFKTRKEAELAAAQAELEIYQGTFIQEKKTSFEDFAQDWYALYMATGKVKISTGRVRQHEIGRLTSIFGKTPIKDISRRMYQEALLKLKSQGYADNTIDGVHRTGRMIFKKAVELGSIKNDPTEYSVVPKTQKTVEELEQAKQAVKYLEKEDLATFLNSAKTIGLKNDYVTFMMLAYTGMRIGELCALKWSDIDFDEHTINITKTIYNPTNNIKEYMLLTPKTKSSVRTIEIDDVLIAVLEAHQAEQKELHLRYQKTYHEKDFVVTKTSEELVGYPEHCKQFENRMKRLLKLCNLNTTLSPHSLRHTHVSLLAEAGVSLEAIMERLGHQDDDTTRNVYLHVTKPKKKEAAHKFSQLMRDLTKSTL